ncbi:MAG: fatty acid CoA ligase family protein [Planctomycetota bacterium]
MLTEDSPTSTTTAARVNVADRLATHATDRPNAVAVAALRGGETASITFREIDHEATTLATGLAAMGVLPGHRIALLVKPGVEFVTLVFALLRSGATMVLVDGGLGRKNIVRCLESTSPDGFVAIPQGHALRVLKRKSFLNAKLNVTVGRRWFWRGETLASLRELGDHTHPPPVGEGRGGGEAGTRDAPTPTFPRRGREHGSLPHTTADDPAAIVFTSGSTGPPKGVVYRHETFVTQADEIQRRYDLRPGAVDLACFPLFGLFNVACGVTTVLPEMDFSRPASCDPKKLFAAANQWKVSQSFASPAVWDKLSRHAEETGERIPTLRKVFSCGAPVPAKVIRRTLAMVHPEAELHTPYGATEALPVATIEANEVLDETAAKTDEGAGVCVGEKFDSVDWRIIRITDDPIATIDEAEELPPGEIGELIVRGPQVSREYLESPHHNSIAKVADGDNVWHRIGDVGYFDEQERFWYCGRKSQRVVTRSGTLYTECVEQLCNTDEDIKRTALVAVERRGAVEPVVVAETNLSFATWESNSLERIEELWARDARLRLVRHLLYHTDLPTDIRHNSKIRREELAVWAAKQLKRRSQS